MPPTDPRAPQPEPTRCTFCGSARHTLMDCPKSVAPPSPVSGEARASYSHVVEGSFRALHDPATPCQRCRRTSGETGRAHILNGTVAGWACHPDCPPVPAPTESPDEHP